MEADSQKEKNEKIKEIHSNLIGGQKGPEILYCSVDVEIDGNK